MFVGNGFANGTSLMTNEAGQLLATASQSMIVSLPPDFSPSRTSATPSDTTSEEST